MLKIQFHGHILLIILMLKKLLERFMKKNITKKQGYDNSFNGWIDEEDIP